MLMDEAQEARAMWKIDQAKQRRKMTEHKRYMKHLIIRCLNTLKVIVLFTNLG